jgi:hypothetical protein
MRISATLCCLFLAATTLGQDAVPKKGYVPDSATAIKIAEAVLIPVYGQGKFESQKPFSATLKDDVWTVSGTLYCAAGQSREQRKIPPPCQGILEVLISKSDAHILDMLPHK